MQPEKPTAPPPASATAGADPASASEPAAAAGEEEPYRGLRWVFIGSQGLRAGWSVLLFSVLFSVLSSVIDWALLHLHLIGKTEAFTPGAVFFGEAAALIALLIAVALVGLIEGRRIAAYNLAGPRRTQHFLFGLAAGFLALSALVGALAAGGWLRFGSIAPSGPAIAKFALLWGCVFLLGAGFEEGMFRCYQLFTLARGINCWWAFGIVAALCAYLAMFVKGTASWGVYAAALLGLVPCIILHQKTALRSGQKAAPRSGQMAALRGGSGFWYAAWVTSTLFGFVHIGNPGEAWIGIFAAALIGFVFCVSVRVTGSAWWAVGCHAAWDWGETFFYGTADSGLTPHGSYLTSSAAGNPLWSGGKVGPEGSVLVIGAILLLLALVLFYGRSIARRQTAPRANAP